MEYRSGALLAHILHTNVRAGIAMFRSVSSEDGKRNMILAAAKEQMTNDDAALVEAVFGVNKAARAMRNAYAHHLWGHSDDLPDALLIIDPRDLQAALAAHNEQKELHKRMTVEWGDDDRPSGSIAHRPMSIDPALISVVRRPDIERAILLVSEASARTAHLEAIALEPDVPEARRARSALRADPLMKQALARASAQ